MFNALAFPARMLPPSWPELLTVGLKSQILRWDEAASGNQLELVQELITR